MKVESKTYFKILSDGSKINIDKPKIDKSKITLKFNTLLTEIKVKKPGNLEMNPVSSYLIYTKYKTEKLR